MIKGGSLTAATFLLFSLHYILKDHQWDDIFLNGLCLAALRYFSLDSSPPLVLYTS